MNQARRQGRPPGYFPAVPWGTWTAKPGKTAALPYVANDNEVWTEDPLPAFGLSAYSSGPFAQELTVTPSSDHRAVFYLKLPPRYSGDNGRVAVYKIDPKTGQEVPDKVPSRSPVYTGWKRVFIEKDRMFRRGGVPSDDAGPASDLDANTNDLIPYTPGEGLQNVRRNLDTIWSRAGSPVRRKRPGRESPSPAAVGKADGIGIRPGR